MENCKVLFANLEQRHETDFVSFCSQKDHVSRSFTLFWLNDEIHQIYEILDSFICLWSLETLKRFKLLISKILLCMCNEFFLSQVITNALYSWTSCDVSCFLSQGFHFLQSSDNSELREMYLMFNLLLCHLIWENKNNAHSDPHMAFHGSL